MFGGRPTGGCGARQEPARSHPGNASGTPSERPLDAEALGRCELHCISPVSTKYTHCRTGLGRWCRRGLEEGWRREGGLGAALMRSRNTGCTARVTPVRAFSPLGQRQAVRTFAKGDLFAGKRERRASLTPPMAPKDSLLYAARTGGNGRGGGKCTETGWVESGGKKRKGSAQWGASVLRVIGSAA